MKKAGKKPQELEVRVKDLEAKWRRTLADYANLEKRFEREKKEFTKFANAVLLDKLLAALDDLERAEAHLSDKGLSIALEQMRVVLRTEGVEEIKAVGQKFDAETMDCAEVVKGSKNIIVEVVNKGYKLNGQVLRPARVKVGQGDLKRKD